MPRPEAAAPEWGPGFAELFGALPVAVLVIDPDDRVVHANALCEQMLNVSERAMQGQPLASILPPPGGERHEGHDFSVFDTEIETSKGLRMRVDFIESEVPDRPGWRAITLHNAANSRRLGHSADRAAGARAAVGAAAMLAHEIKNPLSGIRGAAQLLAGGEGAGELTGLIITEVDRIAALIDRMEDFTDTTPLPLTAENVYPLLDHVRGVARAGFARDVEIEARFDPSLPDALVNCDALLQIILNLLKNAVEAVENRPETRIILTTAYRHGLAVSAAPGRARQPLPIEICVIDNGPGPPADIAEHLFDPFVSGRPEGKGLGLALVDKLMRDMGGIVQFAREGQPPETIFRLLLARAEP